MIFERRSRRGPDGAENFKAPNPSAESLDMPQSRTQPASWVRSNSRTELDEALRKARMAAEGPVRPIPRISTDRELPDALKLPPEPKRTGLFGRLRNSFKRDSNPPKTKAELVHKSLWQRTKELFIAPAELDHNLRSDKAPLDHKPEHNTVTDAEVDKLVAKGEKNIAKAEAAQARKAKRAEKKDAAFYDKQPKAAPKTYDRNRDNPAGVWGAELLTSLGDKEEAEILDAPAQVRERHAVRKRALAETEAAIQAELATDSAAAHTAETDSEDTIALNSLQAQLRAIGRLTEEVPVVQKQRARKRTLRLSVPETATTQTPLTETTPATTRRRARTERRQLDSTVALGTDVTVVAHPVDQAFADFAREHTPVSAPEKKAEPVEPKTLTRSQDEEGNNIVDDEQVEESTHIAAPKRAAARKPRPAPKSRPKPVYKNLEPNPELDAYVRSVKWTDNPFKADEHGNIIDDPDDEATKVFDKAA